MSSLDFQNGFVCGMATKGMLRTEQQYSPNLWNDSGVYNYFYIDFKQTLELFSLGMLKESLVVFDSVQIAIDGMTYISPGIYKIYADLAGKVKGITVMNKANSLLDFSNGAPVPPFSTRFFVAGLDTYAQVAYGYDQAYLSTAPALPTAPEICTTEYQEYTAYTPTEATDLNTLHTADEETIISYWSV